MSTIGSGQPVQYIPGKTPVPSNFNTASTNNQSPVQTQNNQGATYSDDVFTGQYQQFKGLYQNFDTNISKYSPFFGKMGSAQTDMGLNDGSNQIYTTENGNNGQIPPIPSSALTPSGTNSGNGQLPPIPDSALKPNGTTPTNNNGNVQVPATLGTPNQNQQAPVIPKKNPPSGPVMTNLQQSLQQEALQIQTPNKAIESIASHAMLARQERTMANDIAWGAKYYAKQALDATNKLNKGKGSMSPAQIQSQVRQIESLKIKAVSLLNDAKKRAINNYNESLKATMLYNNFFTENGKYASVMNPNDRQFVESELDKTWATWSGGFDKEWNGATVKADDSVNVVDKAAQEVATAIDAIDKTTATLVK
ncbi:MAG: hypothetical protein U0354_02225 [Candidatus Sericytochromatia bacterium]